MDNNPTKKLKIIPPALDNLITSNLIFKLLDLFSLMVMRFKSYAEKDIFSNLFS
jgi:hypothetical protein